MRECVTAKIPEYMAIPEGAKNISASDTIYQLVWQHHFRPSGSAINSFLTDGRVCERATHWALLARTDILDKERFAKNATNWRGQWLHTGHAMYQIGDEWRVDHYFGRELYAVDLVKEVPDGTYLGKAGQRWNRFQRIERQVLHGDGGVLERILSTMLLVQNRKELGNLETRYLAIT